MSDHPGQVSLPTIADMIPRGDGSFILRPRVPDAAGEIWVSARDAARVLGGVSISTVYRLADEGRIEHRRITSHLRRFNLASLHAHANACRDPEFWMRPALERLPRKGRGEGRGARE